MSILSSPSAENINEALGRGFAFPVRIGKDGTFIKAVAIEHVKGSLTRLAMYRKGDMVGVFTLGGNVFSLVGSVHSETEYREAEEDVSQTIRDFEDRVSSVKVIAGRDPVETTTIKLVAIYTLSAIKETNRLDIPVE